jgi:PKD repeat protein
LNRIHKARFFLFVVLAVALCMVCAPAAAVTGGPIIIDHTDTHLNEVPLSAIQNARTTLHIAYGHTSHGSQITDGMNGLVSFQNAPYGGSTYRWNNGGTNGALDLHDYAMPGDLGNPDRTSWAAATRSYLNANPDVNVIMWSWCGQADTTAANINTYLSLMNQLETDYPNVKFVYMTGHLVGTGTNGNLNQRNEQIRAYARANNKILFDFADIESYDPDGLVNYMALNGDDGCNYNGGNWATAWQNAHPGQWYNCGAAHTQPLNANMKAYAAWNLWARLAGWDGTPVIPTPTVTPTPTPTVTPTPVKPVALPGQGTLPTDPDTDGLYEDLSGNGEAGFSDVVLFFKHIDWIADNEPVLAFDFSGNGDIGFQDIVRLFAEV